MKQSPNIFTNKAAVLIVPALDHKEPEDDDCGLPENPIFSNYPKYLWKSHTRNGGVQIFNSSRKNSDEHRKDR
jgi:hypothetical protein